MNFKTALILALVLVSAVPLRADDKKKKQPERALSAGITHVNSDEKLCPQYMVITDEMEYHIRPTDTKHPVLLPVGKEIEFKIKKDEMFLRVVDGDKKMETYHVVSMKSTNSGADAQNSPANSDKP
jgi:hypothetical protein